MKYILTITAIFSFSLLFGQEFKVIEGDKVEITIPRVVEESKDTIDLEKVYDGDVADIAGIKAYIAKLQTELAAAQVQLAEREARFALIEARGKEIKEGKKPKEGGFEVAPIGKSAAPPPAKQPAVKKKSTTKKPKG